MWGQRLVSVEFLSTQFALGLNFLVPELQAEYDTDLYKVTYLTNDIMGNEHVASGLVCVPVTSDIEDMPLACFQHGTVNGRDDVPSNEAGGHFLSIAFSTRGYVVATPDFLGLGDSPGVHPYIHADSEASAAYDLLLATREMMDTPEFEGINLNDQLFISGYSQGGHAAMALQKSIEQGSRDDFTVTASGPMSGPYSVSESMVDFTLSPDPYETVSYIGWLTIGYQVAYPNILAGVELEDIFMPEFIPHIEAFRDEEILLDSLNTVMSEILRNTVGTVTPRNTLLPEVVDALFNDPTHPLSIALADNDVLDWTPSAPTQMAYCDGDDQVTRENAILAEEVMIANGSSSVEAIKIDNTAPLDHGECVIPASLSTLAFFEGFRNLSAVGDIGEDLGVKAYFAENTFFLDMNEASVQIAQLSIVTMAGQKVMVANDVSGETRYDLSQLDAGFYIATITSGNRLLRTVKIVKSL